MGQYRDRMTAKLNAGLAPSSLEIHDDSMRHIGHTGDNPDGHGETHFKVTAVSAAFAGKSRVERQRLVYGLLADELKERVHALELVLRAPGEG
ncbi:MAG: BolA family transcriptional regulator [Rhodospirillaceae bacterium]|nr:BolA family transcriptional regulator [Rhodospirillaceae bacterium]